MFDVLVFLVENYVDGNASTDVDALALKLKAAGFDREAIDDALIWLEGLEAPVGACLPEDFAERSSFRSFVGSEERRLPPETRGFLAYLESSGVIDGAQRERVIERSLAFPERTLGVDRLKIITLMVLWSSGELPDALMFDELLPDRAPHELH